MNVDFPLVRRSRRRTIAKCLIIDRRRNARTLSANRAVGIATQIELAKFHLERVEVDQPAEQWLADAENEFECFDGLESTNDPRKHPEHAGLRTVWHCVGRRRLGKKTAVTGPAQMRREDRRLSVKAEDRAID